MGNKPWLVTTIFIVSLAIYFITSAGDTAFNHFTLLADSFIHGKIYIEEQMPWLEKIPIDNNRFYVANPPMPAILSIFPVFVFGKNLPQQYISFFIGAFIVVVVFLISLRIQNNIKLAIWSSILIGFGTINWYLTTVGSTWYMAQITAELFLLLSIYSLLKNKSPTITGLFLGFAYLARIPTILTIPFFLINLPRPYLRNIILLLLGVAPSVLVNSIYNYLRFGVFWDIGYTMIPGVSTESWYSKGIINPSYIVEHLKIILWGIPNLSDIVSFKPSMFGYAIWFTTPAFLLALKNNIKEKIVWSSWFAIFLVSLLIFSHGSTGFSQFGYRFAVDFYPILIFLTIKSFSNNYRLKWQHWILLLMSVFINFWGIWSLNMG